MSYELLVQQILIRHLDDTSSQSSTKEHIAIFYTFCYFLSGFLYILPKQIIIFQITLQPILKRILKLPSTEKYGYATNSILYRDLHTRANLIYQHVSLATNLLQKSYKIPHILSLILVYQLYKRVEASIILNQYNLIKLNQPNLKLIQHMFLIKAQAIILYQKYYLYILYLRPQNNQFMNLNFEGFNKVTEALKAEGLLEKSTLKEVLTLSQDYSDKWNEGQIRQISGQGSASHKQKYNAISSKFKGDENLKNLQFSLILKEGEKLPDFTDLTNVFTQQKVDLIHKQGEVILIDVWATWCGPCQKPMDHNQKMLESNENWKDKVRIIAVSVDEEIDVIKKRVVSKKWDKIQHLTLGGWQAEHSLIKGFQIEGIPFVCLVTKQGIIDFKGHPSTINLEKRINELINDNQKNIASENTKQNEQPQMLYISQQTFKKIRSNLEDVKKQVKNANGCVFTQRVIRTIKNGKEDTKYGKLRIDFIASKDQIQEYKKIIEIATKNIPQQAIQNNAYVNDPELQLKEHVQYFTSLSDKYHIPKPYNEKEESINALKSSEWTTKQSLRFPSLIIGKQIDAIKARDLKKQIQAYTNKLELRNTSAIDQIVNESIALKFVGSPSFNFTNLKNQKTKQTAAIEVQKGRPQIISIYFHPNFSQAFSESLVKTVKSLQNNTHISFISHQNTPGLQKLQNQNPQLVTIYSGGRQCPQFQLFEIQTNNFLIIVNKEGIIVRAGKTPVDQIKKVLNENLQSGQKKDQSVSKEDIDSLRQIVAGKQLQTFKEDAKSFDYQPQFNIQYSENTDTKQYTKPTVSISARKNHLDSLKNVISSLQKVATVSTTIVETFVIPTGTICQQCKADLKYPYYYYHFSSTFRCVDCAEKCDNETQDLLKKYAVNENGVLVFKQNSQVDVKRFGKNIQPTSKQEAQRPSFMCNGCMQGIQDTRYICMGCRRQPNVRGDYVDFCQKCIDILKGNGDKSSVLNMSADENHKQDHPLLRVNFSPQGYYAY